VNRTIRLEAAQQARGESGGKALEAILAMKVSMGPYPISGKHRPSIPLALNVAAGNKLHFVVCDDDQIAADAIRYLKEERLGRATFLPLNKLKPPALSARSRNPGLLITPSTCWNTTRSLTGRLPWLLAGLSWLTHLNGHGN
jgi:chromosome segregation protein